MLQIKESGSICVEPLVGSFKWKNFVCLYGLVVISLTICPNSFYCCCPFLFNFMHFVWNSKSSWNQTSVSPQDLATIWYDKMFGTFISIYNALLYPSYEGEYTGTITTHLITLLVTHLTSMELNNLPQNNFYLFMSFK